MGLAAQAHLPPRAAHFRVDLRFFAERASVFIGERIALSGSATRSASPEWKP